MQISVNDYAETLNEKLKLIPFLWMLVSLVLGVVCGLWILVTLPLLYFYSVRHYVIIACFIAIFNQLFFIQPTNINSLHRYQSTFVVGESLAKGYYEVAVMGCKDILTASLLRGGFDVVLVSDDKFVKGDSVLAVLFVEDIEKDISQRGFNNTLLARGYRQSVVIDNQYPVSISKPPSDTPFMENLRHQASIRLSTLDTPNNGIALLKAMIIGDKSELSKGMKRGYRHVGLAHILAISGLHIGIIFLMLNLILNFLDGVYLLKLAKVVLIIGLLWVYVYFTGASPSACRAAFMFSMFSIGDLRVMSEMKRYNILFGSAFVMLLFDMTLLYDIGFQLSYFAVGGIIFLAGRIYNKLKTKFVVLNYFLMATSITVSAQIATLPIILHNFAEFSTVSIISNIITAPLIAPILGFGMLYIFTMWEPVAIVLDALLRLVDYIVGNLVKLPYAYFENVEFTIFDLLVLFLAYLLIFVGVLLPRKHSSILTKPHIDR